jgi:hypothetical protein
MEQKKPDCKIPQASDGGGQSFPAARPVQNLFDRRGNLCRFEIDRRHYGRLNPTTVTLEIGAHQLHVINASQATAWRYAT